MLSAINCKDIQTYNKCKRRFIGILFKINCGGVVGEEKGYAESR